MQSRKQRIVNKQELSNGEYLLLLSVKNSHTVQQIVV